MKLLRYWKPQSPNYQINRYQILIAQIEDLNVDYVKILIKNIFLLEIGYILIDLNQIFPMKPSEFKISISVDSYHEQISENFWNSYVAEKRIVSKLPHISIPNFDNTN